MILNVGVVWLEVNEITSAFKPVRKSVGACTTGRCVHKYLYIHVNANTRISFYADITGMY